MAIQAKHINPAGTRVYMGQIQNEDIHQAIGRLMMEFSIRVGHIQLIGSLTDVEFRSFDFLTKQRRAPIILSGIMEIVSAYGHLSYDDETPHIHLHAMLTTPHNGAWISGGHVQRASAFVAEFALWAYDGSDLTRQHDDVSGLRLWHAPEI